MKILRSLWSLAVVAGMKKRMTMQNRQKSNAKKIIKNKRLMFMDLFYGARHVKKKTLNVYLV